VAGRATPQDWALGLASLIQWRGEDQPAAAQAPAHLNIATTEGSTSTVVQKWG